MSNSNHNNTLAMTIIAGIGIGVIGGTLIGLLYGRRSSQQSLDEMTETVQGLQERARHVLDELSDNVAGLVDQSPEQQTGIIP